ncbi:hypothetical protein [Streptomyces sp. NPDC095602]
MDRLTRQALGGAADDMMATLVEQSEDGTSDVVAALLAQARHEREDS